MNEVKTEEKPLRFKELKKELEKQGYILIDEPNDIDIISPENFVVCGWWKEPGASIFPRGLNMNLFDGKEAEKFATEMEEKGFKTFLRGDRGGKYIEGSWVNNVWNYEVEIQADTCPICSQPWKREVDHCSNVSCKNNPIL